MEKKLEVVGKIKLLGFGGISFLKVLVVWETSELIFVEVFCSRAVT